jgi:glyoxylate carboligase
MARSAPDRCVSCGFYLPLGGLLAAALGVCANDLSPADGQVVHAEFGCGAHSEVRVDASPNVPVAELVYDDAELELVPRAPVE